MAFARKRIRLPALTYQGRRLYFVTICCYNRRPFLASAKWSSLCLARLREASISCRFCVHAFCFLPDHVHLLVEGLGQDSWLSRFLARFKQLTAYEYVTRTGSRLWQSRFYDHVLRREVSMERIAWYIWMNPVRKGLCTDPRDFPHSGSMTIAWPPSAVKRSSWAPPWKQAGTPR